MCIHCNNKLLAATDRLCQYLKHSEKDQVAHRLEAALADTSADDANGALSTAMAVIRAVLELEPKVAGKRMQQLMANEQMPDRHDHEQNMLFLLLSYLQLAFGALFGNACRDSDDHKNLVVALMRINTVEASCAAALAATIQYYRAKELGELPKILQEVTFQAFCREAAIPADKGGGRKWRDAQYTRWKRDNLMELYRGDDNGPNVAGSGCRQCWACLAPTLDRKCGGCRLVCSKCGCAVYCSSECQKSDWKSHHKALCGYVATAKLADAEGHGMGLHFDVWAASIYSKWKTRQDNWKPMTASIDASKSPIAIFVAALEARDPVPSYLDEPSELSAGSIADVTDITDELVDRGSGAQVAMAGGRALGRRGRGRARGTGDVYSDAPDGETFDKVDHLSMQSMTKSLWTSSSSSPGAPQPHAQLSAVSGVGLSFDPDEVD